jgi:hypothetical protein
MVLLDAISIRSSPPRSGLIEGDMLAAKGITPTNPRKILPP